MGVEVQRIKSVSFKSTSLYGERKDHQDESEGGKKPTEIGDRTQFPWVHDVTEENAIRFHERLMAEFEYDPYRPIIIHINSYGGEVDALLAMLDTMDAVRSMAPPEFKFITVASGKACSAGAVLLSYGDYRFATPNTRLMLHQVQAGAGGSQPSNEVEFAEITRINAQLLSILKKRCKLRIGEAKLKQMMSHNLYMTPQKAKEFGLIDAVGYPKVSEVRFYDVHVLNGEREKNANRRANPATPKS